MDQTGKVPELVKLKQWANLTAPTDNVGTCAMWFVQASTTFQMLVANLRSVMMQYNPILHKCISGGDVKGHYDYHINSGITASCEKGDEILDDEGCKAAAAALGQPFKKTISLGYAVKGCLIYQGAATAHNGIYWNTHPTGGESADHHRVCRKFVQPAVGNTSSAGTRLPRECTALAAMWSTRATIK